ncbi:DUF1269 domain-containing protein [Leifsonia sp. McL0607]|uniref:DUF1269 domain-containing protein n=1 Tax=Leifsonia sp. McL0607 TaxID=3415672 RepID=UPI003CF06434
MSKKLPHSQILAASFSVPNGASRAADAVSAAFGKKQLGNTAVLTVRPDGAVKFTETKDWGAGKGALVGGAIGLLAGNRPFVGAAVGALASKLRDSGFKDEELRQLGESLAPNESAIVFEITVDALQEAAAILASLNAKATVTAPIDSSVAGLFATLSTSELDNETA